MDFIISSSFSDSLENLENDEQKSVKLTAFDLQMNGKSNAMRFHKLTKSKDKNFVSISVNMDLRIIAHKTETSLLLCYVHHHEQAYDWANRRKIETHPKTGAAQIVEIREMIREIFIPKYVEAIEEATKTKSRNKTPKLLFDKYEDDDLLEYGVPPEWLKDVKQATEDTILELADHLPEEAAQALLELATGGTPVKPTRVPDATPFDQPDARRRFRVLNTSEGLKEALDYPWEKWTIFLHPAQQELVEKDFNGPARVTGSAGTGKTIVALHRAVYLAEKDSDARVLLTTFSDSLANALKKKLNRLIATKPRLGERLEVHSMDAMAKRLYARTVSSEKSLIDEVALFDIVKKYASTTNVSRFTESFVFDEWSRIVDARQIRTWEAYQTVSRLGRRTRLSESQRELLWGVFAKVNQEIDDLNGISMSGIYQVLSDSLSKNNHPPFEYVVVDEAQDLSIPQLKYLAAIGQNRPNALFFSGDLGQRIFQQPFSWKSLGVDIRGRSKTLRVNYRTSHQIRLHADRLLDSKFSDVDGNEENRKGTVSIFNGLEPAIKTFDSFDEEAEGVSNWILELLEEGFEAREIGVFVRSKNEFERAEIALKKTKLPYNILDKNYQLTHGKMTLCTMHLAKGLEFRAVVVMACDDDIIPSQERIEKVSDTAILEDVYRTERHLLYVACTRARDRLFVSSGNVSSEFLDDLFG